jgi:uncharacterized pyridoxamine 5'-phosphate oxidase family protein
MNESLKILKEVISSQYFAVISSIDNRRPYSNLVSFAIANDFKSLIFFTNRNTRKYKNIQESNSVSLLIDNRSNQPSDIAQTVAITVIGNACEELYERTFFEEVFLARHPELKKFVSNPNSALIHVNVHEYIIASFDKTEHVIL